MSTDVALKVDGMSLAEAMGFSTGGGSTRQSTLARINQVHSPLTVTDDEGDEHIKVPVGAYKITMPDGGVVYSKSIAIRIFSQRQQWQRWNSDKEEMEKSLMAANLNMDLRDSSGGFNLGRPSGYIEDWNALPEETKKLIRSVKRVKIYMGMLRISKPTNERGEEVKGYSEEYPFVMDVKNAESMKGIDASINQIMAKKLTPIEHLIVLGSAKRSMPTGAKYAVVVPALGEIVSFKDGDSEILENFLSYISAQNDYIQSKYEENQDKSLSADDAAIVANLVDVQEAD